VRESQLAQSFVAIGRLKAVGMYDPAVVRWENVGAAFPNHDVVFGESIFGDRESPRDGVTARGKNHLNAAAKGSRGSTQQDETTEA
jgi:hypothetical protein